jgi:hypothetical protein
LTMKLDDFAERYIKPMLSAMGYRDNSALGYEGKKA